VSRLIVNADDFGLTAGVNRAIAELHRAGMLTSATLIAKAAATEEAIGIARSTPSLGVGCHVVLVDGEPVLPPAEIPTLVDQRTGRFERTLGAFLRRLLSGRIRAAEMEAEAAAQIALLQARGVALTHIDTHKHVHIFSAVLKPLLRAAAGRSIRAIRNPFEPAWSLRATPGAPWLRRTRMHLLRRLSPAFRKLVAAASLTTTDGAIGVMAAGFLDANAITSLLRSIPPGAWELVTHPGYNDRDLAQAGTRLLGSRDVERQALLSISHKDDLEFISFADLVD
jgi:predicted glycoside hydrolase/deacetylase ChbG (UPF0249 family)